MKATNKTIDYITFFYLGLPILVFFLGWFKVYYGLFFSALLVFSIGKYLRTLTNQVDHEASRIANWSGLLVCIIAFLWVYFSGIGGFANQDWDHHFRNALFTDLIQQKWPVYYSFPAGYKIQQLANTESALNYYFTYWLPASLIGKCLGKETAEISLFIWSYVGVLLTLYYLNKLVGFSYILITSVFFMLWSGMDILGKIILEKHLPYPGEQLDVYYHYFYTSFTLDLYNIFNQAIPAWLITFWVLNRRKEINIVPISLLFAYAPFPFVGLVLLHGLVYTIALFWAKNASVGALVQAVLRECARVENLAILAGVLLPYALFYSAHTSDVPSSFFWNRFPENSLLKRIKSVMAYFMTYFFEVGIYLTIIVLFSRRIYQENKITFWVCCSVLLILPLLVIGQFGDFSSRGSFPLLAVLCVLIIKTLLDYYKTHVFSYATLFLAAVFLLSWITPVVLVTRGFPVSGVPKLREKIGSFSNPKVTKQNDDEQIYSSLVNFYSYNSKQYLFYKYLAKD